MKLNIEISKIKFRESERVKIELYNGAKQFLDEEEFLELQNKIKNLDVAKAKSPQNLLGEVVPLKIEFDDGSFNIECNNCHTQQINLDFKYCQRCGIKFDWCNFD